MKKLSLLLLAAIICLLMFSAAAIADTGPKPSLAIIVKGMGDKPYWLDLLVSGNPKHRWLKIPDAERQKVSKLADYNQYGLHAALLKGTEAPLFGSITGVRQADGSYIHHFSYFGVPSKFKIAILKSDGTLIISDNVKRTQFQSVIEYTVGTLRVNEKAGPGGTVREIFPWGSYFWGFGLRLLVTLIIEIGIALLFGFTLKKSWKILLITNLITQTVLNIAILAVTKQSGQLMANFVFLHLEMLVAVIELAVYCKFLTERKLIYRILYTISANFLSLIAGFILFFLP